jgi:hypothetical protein
MSPCLTPKTYSYYCRPTYLILCVSQNKTQHPRLAEDIILYCPRRLCIHTAAAVLNGCVALFLLLLLINRRGLYCCECGQALKQKSSGSIPFLFFLGYVKTVRLILPVCFFRQTVWLLPVIVFVVLFVSFFGRQSEHFH